MKINKEIQYIDGTKLEADAGKYTFVYKTRIINARKKLWQKISDSIADINKNRGLGFKQNNKYCAQEIGYIVQYLFEIMKKEDIEPAFRAALENKHRPTIIEFMIDPEDLVYPMIKPGGTLEELIMDC